MNDLIRLLIDKMNGERTLDDLVDCVEAAFDDGSLTYRWEGEAHPAPESRRQAVKEVVVTNVASMAASGMLVG